MSMLVKSGGDSGTKGTTTVSSFTQREEVIESPKISSNKYSEIGFLISYLSSEFTQENTRLVA